MARVKVAFGSISFIAEETLSFGRGSEIEVTSKCYEAVIRAVSLRLAPPLDIFLVDNSDKLVLLNNSVKQSMEFVNGDYIGDRFRKNRLVIYDRYITYLSPIEELIDGVYEAVDD